MKRAAAPSILVALLLLTVAVKAEAQPSERLRRIGVLLYLQEDDPEARTYVGAFLQGLQKLGWIVGRNVQIDYRWTAGDADRVRKYAAELVEPNLFYFQYAFCTLYGPDKSARMRPRFSTI
jgi:hypothetical protein